MSALPPKAALIRLLLMSAKCQKRTGLLSVCWRCECDRGFRCEQQKRQRLLQIESHNAVGVVQISDRDVLADVQIEIATPRGEYDRDVRFVAKADSRTHLSTRTSSLMRCNNRAL